MASVVVAVAVAVAVTVSTDTCDVGEGVTVWMTVCVAVAVRGVVSTGTLVEGSGVVVCEAYRAPEAALVTGAGAEAVSSPTAQPPPMPTIPRAAPTSTQKPKLRLGRLGGIGSSH